MSNVNYTGSAAQRFMRFTSTLQGVTETTTDLFNSIMVWVPASLATANIVDYSGEGISADKAIVKTVTADNYNKVMKGELLSQWKHLFRGGTNFDATLYLVVFYDNEFTVETTATSISNAAMAKAFKKLYNLSYFKTLFAEKYDGVPSMGEEPYSKVTPYFDMALCLANLCESEPTLSMFLSFYKPDLTKINMALSQGERDTNLCYVLSDSVSEEKKAATTLSGTDPEKRAKNFWGYLFLLGGRRTALLVNNGVYVDPIRLGYWFGAKNDSRTYIGNKLAKLKLSEPEIKPTGLPNEVEEDVNNNLDEALAANADAKNVAYLLSISDASQNDSEVIDDKTVSGFPINADMIAKYIDYSCSQALAKYVAATTTVNNPVLVNRATYRNIQNIVSGVIQNIALCGRLSNVTLVFPSYAEAKKGNRFVGSAVWSADYDDDLQGVSISGSISFTRD